MEWWLVLSIFLGLLLFGFATGLPVAFVFITINLFALYLWGGGVEALAVLVHSSFGALVSFTLVPIPLFILMGDVLGHSGIIRLLLGAFELWMGRIPGRLSVIVVAAGALFGALSGSALGIAGMMARTIVPEMRRGGYSTEMTLGPVMGGSMLALIIPPTAIGIVLAAVAKISVAQFLMALFVPGLLTAACYVVYVVIRAKLQPQLAPAYVPEQISYKERAKSLYHILPVGFLIFLVTGVIFFGMATPSEAAALGALGSFIVATVYRRLTWETVKKSLIGTVQLTSSVLMIFIGSAAFSQLLALTGGTAGLVNLATRLTEYPLFVLVATQLILLILGMFIDQISMIMISIPIYMPIITVLGFDPVWFCVMVLVNLGIGLMSPPFGLILFVIKAGVPDVSIREIWAAAIPFCICTLVALGLIMAFPILAQWLPGLMR